MQSLQYTLIMDSVLIGFFFFNKVQAYSFRESNSAIFIFASFLNGGQLQIKLFSHLLNFFPFREYPFWGGLPIQESKQTDTKLFPYVERVRILV